MRIDNTIELREQLVEQTREGPVVGWVQRIADLVRPAGVPMERINWNQVPRMVAFEIVDLMNRMTMIEKLLQVMEQK